VWDSARGAVAIRPGHSDELKQISSEPMDRHFTRVRGQGFAREALCVWTQKKQLGSSAQHWISALSAAGNAGTDNPVSPTHPRFPQRLRASHPACPRSAGSRVQERDHAILCECRDTFRRPVRPTHECRIRSSQ